MGLGSNQERSLPIGRFRSAHAPKQYARTWSLGSRSYGSHQVSSRSNLTRSPSIGRPLRDAGSGLPDGSPVRCFRGGFTGSSSESSGLGPPGLWVVKIAPGREREQRRTRLGSRCGGLGPGRVFATASGGDGMPGVVFRPLEYSTRHYSMRTGGGAPGIAHRGPETSGDAAQMRLRRGLAAR
jgi:hypothetical protein